MSTDPSTVKLCDVDSLTSGDVRVAEIDGRAIAYARIDDEWFAIDDTCSHAQVSLAGGYLEPDDRTIECPRHGALFSLETGAALTFPATKPVAGHEVEVRGTEVFVTIHGDEK
ncbi:MAG: 3-phenylpropionate/trans-cinnamate dioxygenase ferredoxin subunit [Verrucomicrobiales bacterium]|jgi:3-phenylpropionate/trans-cinnamate dioxygenase ferredoxin subunit